MTSLFGGLPASTPGCSGGANTSRCFFSPLCPTEMTKGILAFRISVVNGIVADTSIETTISKELGPVSNKAQLAVIALSGVVGLGATRLGEVTVVVAHQLQIVGMVAPPSKFTICHPFGAPLTRSESFSSYNLLLLLVLARCGTGGILCTSLVQGVVFPWCGFGLLGGRIRGLVPLSGLGGFRARTRTLCCLL